MKSSEISSDDETSWAYNSSAPSTRTSTLCRESRKEDGYASGQNDSYDKNGSYDQSQDNLDAALVTYHITNNENTSYENGTYRKHSIGSCNDPCGQTFTVPTSCSKFPHTSSPQLGDSPNTKSIRKLVNYAEHLVKRIPRAKRYHHTSSHSQEVSFIHRF